jgi:hypothetical protein
MKQTIYISHNEVFWGNYCTVYNKGESQNNNINNTVLIIDHAKIVTKGRNTQTYQ